MRAFFCNALMILMIAGSAFGQSAGTRTYTLDFLTVTPDTDTPTDRVRQREGGVGRVGREFDPSWERIPLEMTLVQLDRSSYTIGDPVVYEVTLKNVGTKPLPFPVTQTTVPFDRAHPVTRQAVILLHINDEFLGNQLIGVECTAYSSDSRPESFVMLNPGDVVRVRGSSNWFLPSTQKPIPPGMSWVREVTVKAQLQYNGVGAFNPIEDSNGIKIQLKSRR